MPTDNNQLCNAREAYAMERGPKRSNKKRWLIFAAAIVLNSILWSLL